MDNLDYLREFFDAGIAETERGFLGDVFITTGDFLDIIKPRSNTLRILVGTKGSGKSALLEYLKAQAIKFDIPVLQLTPADFSEWDFPEKSSLGTMISRIYSSIVKAMAVELGGKQSGILNDRDNQLLQDAVSAGSTSPTVVSRILKILNPIGKAVTNIDFNEMLPSYTPTLSSRERAISSYMNDRKIFYVLLDDIDQICNATRTDYEDVIWAEVLALLKIVVSMPNIIPIISVRSEIWRRLSVDNGNRDKYDHIRNMTYSLSSDRETMKNILEQRLKFCKEKYNIQSKNLYEAFFEQRDCKVPNSSERRLWRDYLISSSRDNPRNLIQLVGSLIRSAKKMQRSKIVDWDVENTALDYSKERVKDLINQNKDRFSKIEPLINSFVSAEYEMEPERVRQHLGSYLGQGDIVLSGEKISILDDKVIKIWDLLFNIGFLNPRTIDTTQRRGFVFLPYDNTLVSWVRWNDVQKYTWDIHPCFRSYLYDLKVQEKNRIINTEARDDYKGKSTALQRSRQKRKKGR